MFAHPFGKVFYHMFVGYCPDLAGIIRNILKGESRICGRRLTDERPNVAVKWLSHKHCLKLSIQYFPKKLESKPVTFQERHSQLLNKRIPVLGSEMNGAPEAAGSGLVLLQLSINTAAFAKQLS